MNEERNEDDMFLGRMVKTGSRRRLDNQGDNLGVSRHGVRNRKPRNLSTISSLFNFTPCFVYVVHQRHKTTHTQAQTYHTESTHSGGKTGVAG